MDNDNAPIKNVDELPEYTNAMAWMRAGWEDVRRGLGYRKQYDTALERQQTNYEIGRVQAYNVRAAGLPVRVWPVEVELPTWLGPLLRQAAIRVGFARWDNRN